MIAIPYLLQQFFYRLWQFFEHWYYRSFVKIGGWAVGFLEFLDKFFALKVSVRHFGEPLFQDYSIIGYILGFVFRTFRILAGALTYAVVIALFSLIYVAWAVTPIYILVLRVLYV